ncbi:protein kinase [Arthrobacter sp. SRS-W-1-2016]|uniref:protein kinase domain-containing protein n=1 Tax=Arthrobacter sp. SRS-W-1-2016 TaxID=1930254 RepID=UPI0009910382|nr:protein kinase [Arthrobacter sp. SRS-W-1-2016]
MTAASTSPPVDWTSLLVGEIMGNYRIERLLGQGYFGLVFEAVSVSGGARAAVKILKPGKNDPAAVLDFENEGLLLRKLESCDGVINFLEGGSHTLHATFSGGVVIPIDVPYQALALASGSLDEISNDPVARERLDLVEALSLWRSAVLSLMRMHQGGVAHRDLKCSNCLIMVNKSKPVIRFGDLGRAKDISLAPTRDIYAYVMGRGDLHHSPPEAIFWQGGDGTDDFLAADYYGVGSLFIELLTGFSLTSLVITDMKSALSQGQSDFQSGQRRDLNVLSAKYDYVLGGIVEKLPKSVRNDLEIVLRSLCHPDPLRRLLGSPFSRDRKSKEKLEWILRRIDIVIQHLKIERRQARRYERKAA